MSDRETLPDGSVRLTGERCSFTFTRLRPGAFLVKITGHDRGEFGDAPFDALQAEIGRFGAIELFVDTSEVLGAVTGVREAWTEWFRVHRASLTRVHLVAGSKFVQQTLTVSKLLSRTGELIRIHPDRESFEQELARARARR